jgi:hypothetical protein
MITPAEAARALGQIKTEKKAAASRENGKKSAGPPLKSLDSIPCNCGGEGLEHKSTCPRGRRIQARRRAGLPIG